jgi:hypothetical protein
VSQTFAKYLAAVKAYDDGLSQAAVVRTTPVDPSVEERLATAEQLFTELVNEKVNAADIAKAGAKRQRLLGA